MIRTQIYIPEVMHIEARRLARHKRESFAALLRRLIEQGLFREKKKNKLLPLSNLCKLGLRGGPRDLSAHLDDYLYGHQ